MQQIVTDPVNTVKQGTAENVLARILAPVSAVEFMQEYFQQRPLYIPGSDNKFDFLFNVDDFKYNLDKVDHIRAVFPLLRQAYINVADMSNMLRAGASICVTGMEKAHAPLAQAGANIANTLNYSGKVSFRAYLSPKGCGFDMHFDARVASTLQIGGRKRWWYKMDPATRYPRSNSPHTEYLTENGFNPPEKSQMESVLLSPGDFLCLPAGAWHCAEAEEDSLSLNLALDHKNAAYGDCILLYLKSVLDAEIDHREPMYSLNAEPWTDAQVLAKSKQVIDRMIDELRALQKKPSRLKGHLKDWFEARR